ncbi:MAG: adenosylmethionine--8-amino-7-oxononanoate transaminase [Planctomycetaceae bacterium]
MATHEQLRAWDNSHIWHPFAPMLEFRTEDTPIIRSAEGFELIDVQGRRYLDGHSSLWCNVHGHRVPEIDQAVRDQLDRVSHSTLLGLSSEISIELAKQLTDRTPDGLSQVFYSDSGATAVEAALKIAYQYHQQKHSGAGKRDLFVTVAGAYHGDTIGSVSLGAMEMFHATYRDLLFQTLTVPSPVTFHVPAEHDVESWLKHCDHVLEETIRENADRIAAVVVEPLVQGAAGILVHPEGYLRRVRNLTREHDVLLIADEVAVGFGKTGTMFACEQEDVQPDLMCLAKGLTGGYLPLAATLTTDRISEAFLDVPWAGKTFFHGHTYTGNPLGCAAALASLDLFDKNEVVGNSCAISTRLTERMTEFAERCSCVGEIRQKGVMCGIELIADRDSRRPFPADKRVGHQVTLAARRRGAILRPLGDVVVLLPAAAMPVNLVDRLCDLAFESIEEVVA